MTLTKIFKVITLYRLYIFPVLTKISVSVPFLLNQMTDYGQTSSIVMLGWFKDLIRFWWPWSNFQGHHTTKPVNMSLSALYLLNQLVDFDLTCIATPLGHVEEIIRFRWPWPHFKGHASTFNVKFWPPPPPWLDLYSNTIVDPPPPPPPWLNLYSNTIGTCWRND